MIIDDVNIEVEAGNGGDGHVSFSKTKMTLGPTGGSGGHGGSIYMQGVSDLTALKQFRFRKEIKAQNGEKGKKQGNDGAKSEDTILLVPVGTIINNKNNGQILEITSIGQTLLIAKGGKGGWGNYLFRSATNTSPKEFGKGRLGKHFSLNLQLKMIADVGFIGLPNVGKSSLLNELTRASARVANYPFTTLEPNLGVYYELILADIPGLIEGASEGKGLGIKFLKHVERTRVFFHLVSAESESPVQDYQTVRKELELYNPALLEKQEYVMLSKTDAATPEKIAKVTEEFTKLSKTVTQISIINPESLENIKKILNELIALKTAPVEELPAVND